MSKDALWKWYRVQVSGIKYQDEGRMLFAFANYYLFPLTENNQQITIYLSAANNQDEGRMLFAFANYYLFPLTENN